MRPDVVASFDARSATYDESAMHLAVAAAAAASLACEPGQVLLDVAGGTGLVARACLPTLGPDATAVVLDASPGMLAAAGQAEPRLVRVLGDAHRLPIAGASADRVCCVTALHLLDPPHVLRELARACRPGGLVVVTTWAVGGWSTGRLLRRAAVDVGLHLPDPNAGGTPDTAAALLEDAGLVDVDVQPLRHATPGPPTWEGLRQAAELGRWSTAVRARFELLAAAEDEVVHELLLVRGRQIRTREQRAGAAGPATVPPRRG